MNGHGTQGIVSPRDPSLRSGPSGTREIEELFDTVFPKRGRNFLQGFSAPRQEESPVLLGGGQLQDDVGVNGHDMPDLGAPEFH